MNKTRVGIVAGVMAALAVAGGAAAVTTLGAPARQEAVIHQMSADYPAFETASDLAKASTLVVRATAVEVGPAYRDIPAGLKVDKLPAYKAAQVGTMLHDVTFRIDTVLRGNATAGVTVKVVELGGQIGIDEYVAEAEPSSVKNRSYLLFLTPLQGGKFGVVGGPQGRYLVEKETVKVLDAETGAHGVGRQLHGTNIAAVAGNLGR